MEARGMQTFRIGEGKEKSVIDPKNLSHPFSLKKKMIEARVNKSPSFYSMEIKSGQWTKMST